MVDVLLCKMYNCLPQVIHKTLENLVIPGEPKVIQKYFGNDRFVMDGDSSQRAAISLEFYS